MKALVFNFLFFFSLSVADTGIFSHVEGILLTALESEVVASTEEV